MSNRTYIATRFPVSPQHASPPISFLDELIDAINPLPDDVFDVNPFHDIYAVMKGALGPYTSLLHRKAVMCEVLRVQAAFESDWNWNAGVDRNNTYSQTHIAAEETGAFQVSFDSTAIANSAMHSFATQHGIETPEKFIAGMKSDHRLAVEYCARLLRFSTTWCGTISNPSKVISHVRRDAVEEFTTFLSVQQNTTYSSLTQPGTSSHAHPPSDTVTNSNLNDKPVVLKALEIAKDAVTYSQVQTTAAEELFRLAGENWPLDGCAINLSNLLQKSGLPVPDILQALKLGEHLRVQRGWQVIPIGQQQPGDVGSTCGSIPNHGSDHIYLVVERITDNEMLIADNQSSHPHTRFVTGKGKTPTTFFLRAL